MASPSLPANSQRPCLSPADCRTLQKILHDVRSSSPLSSSPYFSNNPISRLNAIVEPDNDTDEDKVSREVYELAHSDERQDGYEDEDDSMELSDGEDAFGADREDRDTIEDIMNMPGDTAPAVSIWDYSSLYAHDQPTPNGAEKLRLRRASIEKSLEEQCQQQERVQTVVATDGVYDVDLPIDGVSDHGLAVEEIRDLGVVYEDSDMYPVEERRITTNALSSSEASIDCHGTSFPFSNIRRASEGTPLASTSFMNFSSLACAVVQTPNGKHIDFVTPVLDPEIPVDNMLSGFEAHEGEDISSSKRHLNTSAPEEIVELAREVRVEEEEVAEQRELAELDRFRGIDLAPLEVVMEGRLAGDSSMCRTPVKAKDQELSLRKISDTCDSGIEDWNHTKSSQSSAPSSRGYTLSVEQNAENDADVEESNTATSLEGKQPGIALGRPTFVTVIGMLPAAMFWATAAPVVACSSKAFDMIIEKLTGLKV